MSALRQKQTWQRILLMSALPPKADIGTQLLNVRFVPIADIMQCSSRTGSRVLAVTGKVDYGVDDDTGRDGDQVR